MNIQFEVNNQLLKISNTIETPLLFNYESNQNDFILTYESDTDYDYTNVIHDVDFQANEQVLEYDSNIDSADLTFTNNDDDGSIIGITTGTSEDLSSLLNYNYNQYTATFTFNTNEWIGIDKFAIFVDSWSNPHIIHLGDDDIIECDVPSIVLNGTFFKVSVYGGDLISTNSIIIPLGMSGYLDYIDSNNPDSADDMYGVHKDIFVEIFEQIDSMVNSIEYEDKCLNLYGNDGLLDSIYLPFLTEEENQSIIQHIYNLIDTKSDINDIATVGLTGDYNDLNNIPNEFSPTSHTHTVSEVTDFEDNTGVEIKRAYNILVSQIRRYGE